MATLHDIIEVPLDRLVSTFWRIKSNISFNRWLKIGKVLEQRIYERGYGHKQVGGESIKMAKLTYKEFYGLKKLYEDIPEIEVI